MADFIDFKTLARPGSPNTFLLAPDGLCEAATPDEPSPVFDLAPAALFGAVQTAIASEKSMRVTAASDPDTGELRLTAIAVTPLLRFKDDVDIAVLPGPHAGGSPAETAQLAIYSRSRVGYSDLGANARRVRSLIKNLPSAGIRP